MAHTNTRDSNEFADQPGTRGGWLSCYVSPWGGWGNRVGDADTRSVPRYVATALTLWVGFIGPRQCSGWVMSVQIAPDPLYCGNPAPSSSDDALPLITVILPRRLFSPSLCHHQRSGPSSGPPIPQGLLTLCVRNRTVSSLSRQAASARHHHHGSARDPGTGCRPAARGFADLPEGPRVRRAHPLRPGQLPERPHPLHLRTVPAHLFYPLPVKPVIRDERLQLRQAQ